MDGLKEDEDVLYKDEVKIKREREKERKKKERD